MVEYWYMLQNLQNLLYQLADYMIHIIYLLWPIVVLLFVWVLVKFLINRVLNDGIETFQRRQRFKRLGKNTTRAETLHLVSTLTPREFEYYVADIFTKSGFSSRVVGGHGMGDGGIDIELKRDGKPYFVQCKKFIGKDIGVAAVRDFYGAIADQIHATGGKGYFVTTTHFTPDAIAFAKGKRLDLHDGDSLMDLVFANEASGKEIKLDGADRSLIMRNIPPHCPACGRDLVWRKGETPFIGCTGYTANPACYYIFRPTTITHSRQSIELPMV